ILRPFFTAEAMWVNGENCAAETAGVTCSTMRRWCVEHGLGRRVGRPWRVSRVALQMHLDGDRAALRAYHSGDRTSELVVAYFRRFDLARELAEALAREYSIADSAHSAHSGVGIC